MKDREANFNQAMKVGDFCAGFRDAILPRFPNFSKEGTSAGW